MTITSSSDISKLTKVAYVDQGCGGRLCNQLYVFLRIYKKQNEFHNQVQFKYLDRHIDDNNITRQFKKEFILKKYAERLNLLDLYQDANSDSFNKSNSIVNLQKSKFFNDEFGVDFSEQDLNLFINDTIAKSEVFKESLQLIDKFKDNLCIHIRAGDYLNLNAYHFNHQEYLKKALDKVAQRVNKDVVYVYSTDQNYVSINFDQLLKRYFKRVVLVCNDDVTDLMQMSMFKHKILWNSSFSAWSGYISNYIWKDNHDCIMCPKFLISTMNNGQSWINNPKWNIQETMR